MNVYLMEAQLFQMVGPTCNSLDGFGVSSSGSNLPPPPPRTMVESFMAAQKGMLCQILQTQQQLALRLQQQPPLGANPAGPNLVAQTIISAGKDPERPQPYESCSPRVPTQGNIDTIVGAIEMLEEQNSVLSHIVDNILQDRYQGLSPTSLTDGLFQVLFTSVVEQARMQFVGGSYCRMDLPGPTTSVGTRTDYSVGPWDYPACATRHLKAWSTRTTEEEYSVRKLYMSCTIWKTPRRTRLVLSPYSDL
jgi:hypothetical protein